MTLAEPPHRQDAISRMVNTRRTCDLILGVGDGKLPEFRGFAYSYSDLIVMDDQKYGVGYSARLLRVLCVFMLLAFLSLI